MSLHRNPSHPGTVMQPAGPRAYHLQDKFRVGFIAADGIPFGFVTLLRESNCETASEWTPGDQDLLSDNLPLRGHCCVHACVRPISVVYLRQRLAGGARRSSPVHMPMTRLSE